MKIKQSVCVPFFRSEFDSLKNLCREVARIGYSAVEIGGYRDGPFGGEFTVSEVVSLAADEGLVLASFAGHASLSEGCNNPSNHDRIEGELRNSIALAATHQVSGIVCFTGNRIAGQSDLEGMVECAHVLRRVAPYAEEKGVNINVELLNSRVNHPGYLGDRTDWGLTLCEMINSSCVKLLFDIYHIQIMEGDIIRSIHRCSNYIGHFHTAGNPGRHDLDETQEINYQAVFNAISETSYSGYVGHEFRPKGDPISALQHAYKLCNIG